MSFCGLSDSETKTGTEKRHRYFALPEDVSVFSDGDSTFDLTAITLLSDGLGDSVSLRADPKSARELVPIPKGGKPNVFLNRLLTRIKTVAVPFNFPLPFCARLRQ